MKIPKMSWSRLLNWQRLGDDYCLPIDSSRPPWQIDYDRIVFSSAFRRLQDKTQVFPLSGSDYVRTRLTHSLEVSTVARTLGMIAGAWILKKHGKEKIASNPKLPKRLKALREVISPADFGAIVAAAALAHDIGNPPFGHSGEDSVRFWFTTSPKAQAIRELLHQKKGAPDFTNWEGNAQGFRILTQLQLYRHEGGMKITYATLGAFTKYPISSQDVATIEAYKKHGFHRAETRRFQEVAEALGLLPIADGKAWCRHPLAFLMEAADDLCYRIIDFEDGFRTGRIPYLEVKSLLLEIAPKTKEDRLKKEPDDQARVSYLRACAIRQLVKEVSDAFTENEPLMMKGQFKGDLISATPAGRSDGPLDKIKIATRAKVYTSHNVLETEAAGFEIIGGLLDLFWYAVETKAAFDKKKAIFEKSKDTSGKSKPSLETKAHKILQLIPEEYVGPDRVPDKDPYTRLLKICDYVTGMTDSYALSLYRKLKGIALPNS